MLAINRKNLLFPAQTQETKGILRSCHMAQRRHSQVSTYFNGIPLWFTPVYPNNDRVEEMLFLRC
jgi:hypothetical protein